MTTDAEAIVRRAYHFAQGGVLDIQGFNAGQEASYRGEHLGDVLIWMGELVPDVHRELQRVNVLGDVVAIELSIQGTFLGPFETPAGVIQPTGAKLHIPCADFWYVREGKIQEFNCYVSINSMLAQIGVLPDYVSAVAEPASAG